MNVAVLIPVLGRPHRVQPITDSVRTGTPDCDLDILFVCDPDDTATIEQIEHVDARYIAPGGNYASKINLGVRETTAPLLFLGADDLRFHDGWLPTAAAVLTDTVQVVGVNDLCSRRVRAGLHATHFLMARDYALRPTIDGGRGPLCEVYDHSFVDDELVATARARGAFGIARDAIVEHMHPDAGRAEWDDTYTKGRQNMVADRLKFTGRVPLWT